MRTRSLVRLVLATIAMGALLAPVAAQAMDGGRPPETTDQRAYRSKYVAETREKQNALLRGLVWTPEVHKVVDAHWRRAYRTIRVHEVAEDNGDSTAADRADHHLRKIDGHFFATLSEMAPDLPKIGEAPALVSPTSNAAIQIGTRLDVTMAPPAGTTPTEYYCAVSEGGEKALVNYDVNNHRYGNTPTCTFGSEDVRWSRFTPGTGGIWVATLTRTKSKRGVDYTQWSHQTYIPVTFTAPPTIAPGGKPLIAPTASGGNTNKPSAPTLGGSR